MTAPSLKAIATLLCVSLVLTPVLSGQQQPPPPVFVPGASPGAVGGDGRPVRAPGIKIVVLEGRMSVNRLKDGIFVPPVVEVRDGNDRPIEGALVVFTLPGTAGPGASFADGSTTRNFTTNAQGQAAADGYTPSNIEGKFEILVQASYENEKTQITIPQANSFQLVADAEREKGKKWRKWLWIGGGVAAATIVATVLLTRDSGSSSGPPLVIVQPGPPVIGGR